jgi:hypothetical protein
MPDTSTQLLVQIIQRLDGILAWQQRISEQLGQMPVPAIAETGQNVLQTGNQQIDRLLRLLLAQVVQASPARTIEFTINNVTPTLIYGNNSSEYQRIEVTNDDPAQPCWIGDRNVTPLSGQVLLAQRTTAYVLPRGAELYTICAVATISVRVAVCYDLVGYLEGVL